MCKSSCEIVISAIGPDFRAEALSRDRRSHRACADGRPRFGGSAYWLFAAAAVILQRFYDEARIILDAERAVQPGGTCPVYSGSSIF